MRKFVCLISCLFVFSACGSDTDLIDASGPASTAGIGGLELAGGATFAGAFEPEAGIGPGLISFTLDADGERIVSAIIDPALREFACPSGVIISGGGISGTYTPGIAIEGGVFDKGDWRGVFDSPTQAHGVYNLKDSFDCLYEIPWTATSETSD